MNLNHLFNKASGFAQKYDGSEPAYVAFMDAAIAYDQAGGEPERVDALLGEAISALSKVNREEDFVERLKKGGAQVFHHGAVFVQPDPQGGGLQNGDGEYTPPEKEPRLREVVMVLQGRGIYFDDLILDIGRVSDAQMRIAPYVVITIPRLNAQIVVADQKGEALFVANPAIPYMNWALFEKKMAGQEDTPFENVRRIVHAGQWEGRMMQSLFGKLLTAGPKVQLPSYVKVHRKTKYPLTEEMIVAMARLYRERHPEKRWPTEASGQIDPNIVFEVTGDPHWQAETWGALGLAGRKKNRGLITGRSLARMLETHGCHYNLTEEMIVAMARLYRERDPERQWPTERSGPIDPDIILEATGDPHWQAETWGALGSAGAQKIRGLTTGRGLTRILEAHGCHYNLTEEMVVAMARLYRERHPEKQWPKERSGPIDPDIILAVTGDPHWQAETWRALDKAGAQKYRGLTTGRSLARMLEAHGCHYNLTEEMIVAMARLYREREPEKRWPRVMSGPVDPDIILAVTGDPHWQAETWISLGTAGEQKNRGLITGRSLAQTLNYHCPEREGFVAANAFWYTPAPALS